MNEVINLLKESGAMMEGHFILSSGRHSDQYFQCARLLQYPEKTAAALAGIVKQIKADIDGEKLVIDAVVGPALGGIIVAYELGRLLGIPALYTERDDNGLMCLRRGFSMEPGRQILIAEDVVTTGKSSGECAAALEVLGAQVTALACLVDRRTQDVQDIDWPMYSALKVHVENWDTRDCELCKKGIPAVKPGSRKT